MSIDEFKNPDSKYRPAPFWSWNDNLDEEELKRQIHEMTESGWGGYFCHSRVGLVTGYLSEEWMDMIRTCALEAKKTGTYAWLYDEDKWPSGYASGMLAQDEANRDRCIMMYRKTEIPAEDTILKEFTYNTDEYAVCRHVMPLGDEWFNGACYVDLMSPDTVKAFISSTHEKYKEACGEFFGKEIPGIFTDEPCYFMKNYYKNNKFKSLRSLPWSDGLPEFFKELKGYSIIEHIEELFLNVNDYRKTRFDFYDTATKLFVKSFTKQYYEWCENNHLVFTGHFMAEDSLILQTEWIGAAMPHYEYMQWPGIDKLGRTINELVTIKQLTSVTDQLDKERAFSEAFGCIGQHTSFFHRKWLGDWQAILGINFFNHHLSLYSMRGERKRDYPPNFFYQQPWWDCEKPFGDYIGRLSYAATRGKRDVDILVIHPVSSAWCDYTPQKELRDTLSSIKEIDAEFTALSKGLAASKLDFHYGDEIIMEKHARIENGKLFIGSYAYSTVIVPHTLTLRSNTLKLLKDFKAASESNTLILVEPVPQRVDGAASSIQWPGQAETASCGVDVINMLDRKYAERINITNRADGKNAEKVLLHERTSEDGKYLFLANTDDTADIDTVISIKSSLVPYALDLTSGDLLEVPYERNEGRIIIKASFKPAGSLMLYLPSIEAGAKKAPSFLDSGVEFSGKSQILGTINSSGLTIDESNVMRLDNITLWIDGNKVLEDELVSKAWYDIFYMAKDGTPFIAEYTFDVASVPQGEIFAVIEMAENLNSITLNGSIIKPLKHAGEPMRFNPETCWKDPSFTKVPFKTSLLKEGRNVLTIKGKKVNNITGQGTHAHVEDFKHHKPTEIENIYIVGNFTVSDVDRKKFFIDSNAIKLNPNDITLSGYPFYAGSIDINYEFDIENPSDVKYIKANDVKAACIEMCINGANAGVKYWEPYMFNAEGLLHSGRNTVSIKASTTLFNLMGPNYIEDVLQRPGVGPYTFVDYKKYTDTYVLLPFGTGSISILK